MLIVGIATGMAVMRFPFMQPPATVPIVPVDDVLVVQQGESIGAAIERAKAGSRIIVEPGEYRERIFLRSGIHLMSRVPRGATIRLPSSTSDADAGPAVVSAGVANAELSGFKIVGDAATPLAVGIGITLSDLSISDVEVSGATRAGIDFGSVSSASLLGSEIHDNPGAALIIRSSANPRVTNTVFTRNGMSERASGSLIIEAGSTPQFRGNVFAGLTPDSFVTFDAAGRLSLRKSNWFVKP